MRACRNLENYSTLYQIKTAVYKVQTFGSIEHPFLLDICIDAVQLPLSFVHMCLFKPGVFPADSQREPPSINLAARNVSGL